MNRQTFSKWAQVVLGLFVILAVIVSANAQTERSANQQGRPGSLNYVEGRVLMGTEVIDPKSVGSAELEAGQTLTTEEGKAEILLTPGAFLRLGDNSAVKVISLGLTNTELQVRKGRALIEVAEIHKENDLRVRVNEVTTELVKDGLYEFDADLNLVRVFDGKADVQRDSTQVEVKGGHQSSFNASLLKSEKFDEKLYKDDLYNWSSLRSQYLAEANTDAARTYVVGGPGWWGAGWYWDPWYSAYTFIPASGFLFSPFGWGFYSPTLVYRSPYIIYGHYPHRFYGGYLPGYGYRAPGIYRSHGFYGAGHYPGGGFHGGGVRGGGFHGGGFHGGGFHGGGRR
jgi:FecR-like protein